MKKIILFCLILYSIGNAFSQSPDWVRVGPKGFGKDPFNKKKQSSSRIKTIRVSYSPSVTNPTIFVSTYQGIFKTADKGENFAPIANFASPNWLDDNRMSDFIVHPSNPNFIVGAFLNGKLQPGIEKDINNNEIGGNIKQLGRINIYKTLDEGLSWTYISNFDNSVSHPDKIRFVNKFLFSLDTTTLFAATNYGLYQCNINSSAPVWSKVEYWQNQNISDIAYKPGSTTGSWTLYVSGNQIAVKTSSVDWLPITSSSITGFSATNLCFLAFGKTGNLIAKRQGSGYLNSDHVIDCAAGELSGSLDINLRNYNLFEYDQATTSWSLKKSVDYHDGHLWTKAEDPNNPEQEFKDAVFDYSLPMVNDNEGNIYLGRDVLVKIDTQNGYSTTLESVYLNHLCSATHGDIMGMFFNPYTDELYVSSHGTFGVYNTKSTAGTPCQKWNILNQNGLPGSFIKTMASSPFANGELAYSVWDQRYSSTYQIGDTHYGNVVNNHENSNPYFFLNDRYYMTSGNNINYEGDPFIFGPNERTYIKCYDFTNSNYYADSWVFPGTVYQVKRGKDTPPGEFYYIDGLRLYYVKDAINNSKLQKSIKLKETIADLSIIRPEYSDFTLQRMTVIDRQNIFLILYKGPQNYMLDLTPASVTSFENKVLKTNDGGITWTDVTLPPSVAVVNFTNPGGYCTFKVDGFESYIKKFIIDPFDSKKYYITMGGIFPYNGLTTIYYSENEGQLWKQVYHQYADVNGPSTNGYSGANRPQLGSNYYLQGLPTLPDGVILPYAEDFDINPNTGDPVLATDHGVFYKKDGFTANTNWTKFYYSSTNPKVQPRNGRFIEMNTAFNKMYVAGSGGIFAADIPCFNQSNPLTLYSFQDRKLYQTSSTITSSSAVPSGYSITVRAGEGIDLLPGFSVVATANSGSEFVAGNCNYFPMLYQNVRVEPSLNTATRETFFDSDEEEKKEEVSFTAYPNPTLGYLKIVSKNKNKKISSLTLLSVMGAKLLEVENINEIEYELDLTPYSEEFFIIQTRIGSKVQSIKVLKFKMLNENPIEKK